MSDISELPIEIEPTIESRLRSLEASCGQDIDSRICLLEEKVSAVPAQCKQALDASRMAAEYAERIRRMVIRGPVAGSWIRNCAGVGGLTAIAVGSWWLSPPCSLMLTGFLCFGLVVIGALFGKTKAKG